jgi:predicted RNA binding protein YcfA (HicA-like mRNA interferase family)
MKIREVIRILEADGWQLHSQKGSHRHFKHPLKAGRVTVPVTRMNSDLNPKTERSILRQAQIEKPKGHH